MNRKTWLTLKLILLVILFLLLCLFTGSFLLPMSPLSGRLRAGNRYPGSHMQPKGEAQAFDGVEKIIVQSVSLPVSICESDVEQVTVRDNSRSFGLKLGTANTVTEEGGTLTIRQGKHVSVMSVLTGNFEIEIPRGTILEYDLKNVSGSIYHDAPSREELKVKTTSGSIKILQGGDTANARSTSGSVRIYGPFREVRAQSTSGSVRATADGTSQLLNCSTTSGSVKIQLNQVSGYEMAYSSTSGSIKDLYTDTSYSKSGRCIFGDGTLRIDASSVSGSIKLMDWD